MIIIVSQSPYTLSLSSHTAGVSKDRCARLARYYSEHVVPHLEQRGGNRGAEEQEAKLQAVADHIQSFTCRASHYARRGAPGRKYLPYDLSVARRHRLFAEPNHQQVSRIMQR